jgi:hypothetical protein
MSPENEHALAYRVALDLYAPEPSEWSILVRSEQISVGDILDDLSTAHTDGGVVTIDGSPDSWEVLKIELSDETGQRVPIRRKGATLPILVGTLVLRCVD